jgi:hypothetical protein
MPGSTSRPPFRKPTRFDERGSMNLGWHDLVGSLGVSLILGTYLALQLGRMRPAQPLYSLLNALGAAGVLVSLVVDFNLPAFIIESAWLAISLLGLLRAYRSRRSEDRASGP